MQVGDIVKSLDFNGIDNCYMVGKVVGVYERDGTFRAKFVKRVAMLLLSAVAPVLPLSRL